MSAQKVSEPSDQEPARHGFGPFSAIVALMMSSMSLTHKIIGGTMVILIAAAPVVAIVLRQ